MKLIIKQYLSSLRERDELDAVLPDLLSQMGMNVFSRPGRGTRQDGVDVGAVGSMDGCPEKVYLFTIKAGDITRATWDSGVQAVRQSLNEIIDAYIPNRLPDEYREKDIIICICCGGDVQEPVRPSLEGFIRQHSSPRISFEQWNGDKIANLIQDNFLRDDLLPRNARGHLRKSLAMLDEPDIAYEHFATLVRLLSATPAEDDRILLTAIRQMGICLWIQFAWARDAGNLEATYISSELTLLHAWQMTIHSKRANKTKTTKAIESAFFSIFHVYFQVCAEFNDINILPHVEKRHALSGAIRGSNWVDVNFELFDLLGRASITGIWALWFMERADQDNVAERDAASDEIKRSASATIAMISNNPALLSPARDDQCIDISISLLLIAAAGNLEEIIAWLSQIVRKAEFAYASHGNYPCNLHSYTDLLDHPKRGDDEYRKNVTCGSVLYPTLALWAALLQNQQLYDQIAKFKEEHLVHCNFQFWYPDDESERHFYTNDDIHGAAFSNVPVDEPMEGFLKRVFGECDQTRHFEELSAVKYGWWPLIVVACRHYRQPIPLQPLRGLYPDPAQKTEAAVGSQKETND